MNFIIAVLVLGTLCQNTLAGGNSDLDDIKRRFDRLEDRFYSERVNIVSKMLLQDAPPETEEKTFKNIGLSKSYFYENDKEKMKTWPEAVNYCKQLDAHLASPQNEAEFLRLKYADGIENCCSYWIDISDHVSEGTFLSQTSGLPAPYIDWGWGAPSSSTRDEDCVQLRGGYGHDMYDANCMDKNFYICEKNPEVPFFKRLWKWITELF
ncbi:C-type lectin 37Db-like [Drosophila kikkawai]|uniref:C-type lectin 37Db-like n=1 Tax=Drosophila kikkawai TaxID=30033 RepID=A0A6P4I2U2_DROKI|nr:C-type lectin 37Db-like [Drosophila kikkawai]